MSLIRPRYDLMGLLYLLIGVGFLYASPVRRVVEFQDYSKYVVSLIDADYNRGKQEVRIRWMDPNDLPDSIAFSIYRSTNPIDSAESLANAKKIGTVGRRKQQFIDLIEEDEDMVLYYSVLVEDNGREYMAFLQEQNYTTSPIRTRRTVPELTVPVRSTYDRGSRTLTLGWMAPKTTNTCFPVVYRSANPIRTFRDLNNSRRYSVLPQGQTEITESNVAPESRNFYLVTFLWVGKTGKTNLYDSFYDGVNHLGPIPNLEPIIPKSEVLSKNNPAHGDLSPEEENLNKLLPNPMFIVNESIASNYRHEILQCSNDFRSHLRGVLRDYFNSGIVGVKRVFISLKIAQIEVTTAPSFDVKSVFFKLDENNYILEPSGKVALMPIFVFDAFFPVYNWPSSSSGDYGIGKLFGKVPLAIGFETEAGALFFVYTMESKLRKIYGRYENRDERVCTAIVLKTKQGGVITSAFGKNNPIRMESALTEFGKILVRLKMISEN